VVHGDPSSLLANPSARSSVAGVILCAYNWIVEEQSLTRVLGT
jgi:hypothetical protein